MKVRIKSDEEKKSKV